MQPKVSVIIPCYNTGLFLQECLDSVVNQTLKDIEIICVNDGSTDDTPDILNNYALHFSMLRVIEQDNSGVSAARNNGMSVASGEYLAFMDSDDFYPGNDVLECLYNKAKENNVLICGGTLSILKDGSIRTDEKDLGKYQPFKRDNKMSFRNYHYAGGFTRFIYNREFLNKDNIRFPAYATYEDPPFFVRAMALAGEFYGMRKITYCYRKGYKSPRASREMAIGYAKGILDVLATAGGSGWIELYTDTIEELNIGIKNVMYRQVSEDSLELNEYMEKINKVIDTNLIPKDTPYYHNPFLMSPQEILDNRTAYHNMLKGYGQLIIYGAGTVGSKVLWYLKKAEINNIMCFAVSEKTGNPEDINGIPVRAITELLSYKESALVLIAVSKLLIKDIRSKLEELKFVNVIQFEFI